MAVSLNFEQATFAFTWISALILGSLLFAFRFYDRSARNFGLGEVVTSAFALVILMSFIDTDPNAQAYWRRLAIPLLLAVPWLWGYFAADQAQRVGLLGGPGTGPVFLTGFLATEAIHAWRPGLWLAEPGSVPTPLFMATFTFTSLVFAVGAVALFFTYRRAPSGPHRKSVLLLSIAYSMYAGIHAAQDASMHYHGLGADPVATWGWAFAFVAVVLLLALLVLLVLDGRRSPRTELRGTTWAFLSLPVLSHVLGASVGFNGGKYAMLADAFQCGGFTLLAIYAIVRYRLFLVDLRIKQGLLYGTTATVLGVAALATYVAARAGIGHAPALAVAVIVLGLLLFLWNPLAGFARRFLDLLMPGVEASPAYYASRRAEVYRADIEDALRRSGVDPERDRRLQGRRAALQIQELEHRAILAFARSDVATPGRRVAGGQRYHVERELGRGTTGRVLLARDLKTQRHVVLKQPLLPWIHDPSGRQRFLREVRLLARIDHPHIVKILDIHIDQDPPLMVLEYVPGGSLEQALGARKALPMQDVARLADGLLDALAHLHRFGIIHRDIKPQNILLDEQGAPKLTDFDIARPPPDMSRTVTRVGGADQPGSPAYMSPEQARGQALDARSDLYSAAAVLFRALTGRHYFEYRNLSDFEVRRKLVESEPDLGHADLDPPLRDVLARALAKDPKKRYANAEAMRAALRNAFEASGTPWPIVEAVVAGRIEAASSSRTRRSPTGAAP